MTNRKPRPVSVALRRTRRWTAGVLLGSTLAAGGLGVHLADAYAATRTQSVVAAADASATPTSSATTASSTPTTTGSTATSSAASATGSSSATASTTTGSASSGSSTPSSTKALGGSSSSAGMTTTRGS